MFLVADYRRHAEECRRMALDAPPIAREQLIRLADKWVLLAEERERFVAALDQAKTDPTPA